MRPPATPYAAPEDEAAQARLQNGNRDAACAAANEATARRPSAIALKELKVLRVGAKC